MPDNPPLLDVRDLVTEFRTDEGVVRAVDGVSFSVPTRGVLGIVGESGCGKSVTALSIMRLIPQPPGHIAHGEIVFEGQDLLRLSERQMRSLRGNQVAMIFQEPMTSLNPVYTVGQQLVEAIQLHQKLPKRAALSRAKDMLALVGIPSPSERIHSYPHQLSGGMRQRVMIAMALSCEPTLLIADEPTTALDVTIQAQILELLLRLQQELAMSIVLISHDLGIIAEFVQDVVVMYAGKVVEEAKTAALFASPQHPYTQGLLSSVPSYADNAAKPRLPTIPGMVPDLRRLPTGCRFQDRCPAVIDQCRVEEPMLMPVGLQHRAACFVAAQNPSRVVQ